MLGELENLDHLLLPGFKQEGDIIMVLGDTRGHIGGSEYLKVFQNRVEGDCPPLDLLAEKNLQRAALSLIRKRLVHSAHDVSDGGLAICLAECCMDSIEGTRILGARVSFGTSLPAHLALFGEDQSRIVISLPAKSLPETREILHSNGVPSMEIGKVGSGRLVINDLVNIDVAEVASIYMGAIEEGMGQETAWL
jgi:phosphoribosylformylglycinamidine synthase